MTERSDCGGKGMWRPLACALLLFTCSAMTPQAKTAPDVPKSMPTVPGMDDRQKAMQADMDRLLQLARQLKAEVDHIRKDELSVKVIRDADEIDKLARSARGRIR